MLAGIAAYVKRVRPGVLVIGVEAEDAAGMTASIKARQLTTLDQVRDLRRRRGGADAWAPRPSASATSSR